jgi:hypothetical protein
LKLPAAALDRSETVFESSNLGAAPLRAAAGVFMFENVSAVVPKETLRAFLLITILHTVLSGQSFPAGVRDESQRAGKSIST